MCPDQVDLIHRHAPGRNEPALVDERQRAAAWKFYCIVLGGRQVWPFGVARDNGTLWFEVGNVVIETGPQFRDARARMAFAGEVVEDLAIRCWDAGFSVLVSERRRGPPSLALIDPFGRHIDLVPSDGAMPHPRQARPSIEALAKLVNLSPSALHSHFKAVAAVSPIQYQKRLRLQEARRHLLSGATSAEAVAYDVGYARASQFSREYVRLFGQPPRRDAERVRDELSQTAASS